MEVTGDDFLHIHYTLGRPRLKFSPTTHRTTHTQDLIMPHTKCSTCGLWRQRSATVVDTLSGGHLTTSETHDIPIKHDVPQHGYIPTKHSIHSNRWSHQVGPVLGPGNGEIAAKVAPVILAATTSTALYNSESNPSCISLRHHFVFGIDSPSSDEPVFFRTQTCSEKR